MLPTDENQEWTRHENPSPMVDRSGGKPKPCPPPKPAGSKSTRQYESIEQYLVEKGVWFVVIELTQVLLSTICSPNSLLANTQCCSMFGPMATISSMLLSATLVHLKCTHLTLCSLFCVFAADFVCYHNGTCA